MLRYTRCNIVTLTVEIFSGDFWKVRYTKQIRTGYRNWRTTSATQLQPTKSLCYIGYTSTLWQHDCWLTVQTLYAIYILTSERIPQGHVQNGSRATFSWPTCVIPKDEETSVLLCGCDPWSVTLNLLNTKLNPICHLLALLGTHHILHVSRIRVNGRPYAKVFPK